MAHHQPTPASLLCEVAPRPEVYLRRRRGAKEVFNPVHYACMSSLWSHGSDMRSPRHEVYLRRTVESQCLCDDGSGKSGQRQRQRQWKVKQRQCNVKQRQWKVKQRQFNVEQRQWQV